MEDLEKAWGLYVQALLRHDTDRTVESWIAQHIAFHRWRDIYLALMAAESLVPCFAGSSI